MSRGYRGVFLAACGWLILCGAQPPEKQAEGGNSSQPAPLAPTFVLHEEPKNFAAYPDYNPDRCYHSKDHDAADLCAQWRAAIAAEKAAHEARRANLFAIIATMLGTITTGFVVWTFSEQRRTTRRQLRAYVNIHAADLVDGSTVDRQSPIRGFPAIAIAIKNAGQTPAHHMIHWARFEFCDLAKQSDFQILRPLSKAHSNSISPDGVGTKFLHLGRKLTRLEQASIRAGTHGFILFGRIEYQDVFGCSHWSEYRMYFQGRWPLIGSASLTFAEDGNADT